MQNKTAALSLADKTPENMTLAEIFSLLTDEEKKLVISYSEKLKETRRIP